MLRALGRTDSVRGEDEQLTVSHLVQERVGQAGGGGRSGEEEVPAQQEVHQVALSAVEGRLVVDTVRLAGVVTKRLRLE